MFVQNLIHAACLTPPAEPVDWAPVEQLLSMRLPSDYCELVDAGGAGVWFNDLSLYSPGDELKSHDLLESGGVFEDLLLAWEDDPEYRLADLPGDSRLIAWAATGHGETLFWRVDASSWTPARSSSPTRDVSSTMTDLLIAVTPGDHRFDPDQIAAEAVRRWPSSDDVDVTGPELTDLAELLSKQLTIRDGRHVVLANFHADRQGIGLEGDDELVADFLALVTQYTTFPAGGIVVVHWADEIVALSQNMTPDDVRALRD